MIVHARGSSGLLSIARDLGRGCGTLGEPPPPATFECFLFFVTFSKFLKLFELLTPSVFFLCVLHVW